MPWDRAFEVDAGGRTVQFWIDYDYHHFKRVPRGLIAQIPVATQGRFELLAEGSLERQTSKATWR